MKKTINFQTPKNHIILPKSCINFVVDIFMTFERNIEEKLGFSFNK